MESITELVRNLSLLLLAAAFAELLIPKGQLSALVRLILGLLLLAGLLSPILRCFGGELEIEAWADSLLPAARESEDYARQGNELAAALEMKAVQNYKQSLEQQLCALAQSQSGVGRVEAFLELNAEGQPDGLELYFYQTEQESAAACRQLLARELGIGEQEVQYQILSEEAADEKE